VFTSVLNSQNEAAAIPIPDASERGGSGDVTITFAGPRDASGNFTGGVTATFQFNLTGFPAGTVITLAHIHTGAAGIPGGVVVNTAIPSTTLSNGAGTLNATDRPVDQTLAQTISNSPQNYYFNVHTSKNPSGIVRGQLAKQ
jgi:hypothetical protein